MAAHLISVTAAVHEQESYAAKTLASLLPDDWILFTNISTQFVPVGRGAMAKEIDCLIIGRNSITIVDFKSHSGDIQAFKSRPWEINGHEFLDKRGKPVKANNPDGFFSSLERRCFQFKDFFGSRGFDTFIKCHIVFSSSRANIKNPADAILASRITEFSKIVLEWDRNSRKSISDNFTKFCLSYFTEGDEKNWPVSYRSSGDKISQNKKTNDEKKGFDKSAISHNRQDFVPPIKSTANELAGDKPKILVEEISRKNKNDANSTLNPLPSSVLSNCGNAISRFSTRLSGCLLLAIFSQFLGYVMLLGGHALAAEMNNKIDSTASIIKLIVYLCFLMIGGIIRLLGLFILIPTLFIQYLTGIDLVPNLPMSP
jgi:hypothetical protein